MQRVKNSFLIFALALVASACQQTKAPQLEPPAIDWKSLEFTCVHQKELWPKITDLEADRWFQTARAYEKSGKESLEEEMRQLYEKAAERNHFKAMQNLALYYVANGNAEDLPKAIELVERLIAMNIGGGYYQMATFLEQGIGVEPDPKAALAYYRKSADLGSPRGQYYVGKKLLSIHKDAPESERVRAIAIQMLECALAQGEAKAGDRLGWHFAEGAGDASRGLAYFQRAAALGNMDSLYVLHTAFKDGDWGTNIDPARAACYYKLLEEVRADNKKTFPNIDRICPLPPKPLPPAGKA